MLTAEDVTIKIIEGIKEGKAMVGVPDSVYILPLVKAIPPSPSWICFAGFSASQPRRRT
jgi:hypothetical protein